MKKLFITFAICLTFAGISELNAVNYLVASIQQSSAKPVGDGYTKDSRKVYFRGNEVKYADPSTFRNLGSGYAKDNFAVFYNGIKIPGASVSSFRPTQDGYATDNQRTYYRGKDASKMGTVSEDDYAQISPEGYCIHEGKVYYNAVEMKDADVDSFLDKSAEYAQDVTNVYYSGKVLPGAEFDSFECFYDGYAKDAEKVYYNREEIVNGLSDSFDCLSHGYAKDAERVYYNGKEIKDAVPYSFETTNDGHAKDSKQEYYQGEPVAGSTGSLENLGDGDAMSAYYKGVEIEDASSSMFENQGNGYAKDNNNRYYMGKKVDK